VGLQQRATAADIILSEPSELTSTTMDEGTDFVSSTIVALANEGVPAGSAERLLGAIGSVLSGTIDALAVGSAASNGTANSSNASDVANSTANSGSNLGVNSTCPYPVEFVQRQLERHWRCELSVFLAVSGASFGSCACLEADG
jgi:hypothetical protein